MLKKTAFHLILAMSLIFTAGCIMDPPEDYLDTFLEFYDGGTYVYFPGGYDPDPDYQDLICAWIYWTGAEYGLMIDAAAAVEDGSESFVFDVYGDSTGVYYPDYYDLNTEAIVDYYYGTDHYYSYSGYVEITSIEGIGGAVEGEFEGYFTMTPGFPVLDMDVTSGRFRALRVEQP